MPPKAAKIGREANQQEENGHQSIVDPMQDILFQVKGSKVKTNFEMPELQKILSEWGIGNQDCHTCAHKQDYA
jgi:hypothetical protein